MRERLDKVTKRVDQARARLAEHPTYRRLQRRLAAAEADHAETLALYESTPGGQQELRTAMEATIDPNEAAELAARLEAARQLREEQTRLCAG
ncbi:hypothetical protein GS495_12550 [Rhodococcus hoagii]|nr:hypothetical protein [Prescottella equi]